MNNLAQNIHPLSAERSPVLAGAFVMKSGDDYVLQDQAGSFLAELTDSCLMTPSEGDHVLVAKLPEGGPCYILAVIKRADRSKTNLELEGDVRISAKNGELNVSGSRGVHIVSPQAISIVSEMLGMTAAECEMAFPVLSLASDTLQANVSRAKLFVENVNSLINSSIAKFQSRAVYVKGLDHLNAGSIKQAARQLLTLSGKFSFLSAEKNVKVDGKQILMG